MGVSERGEAPSFAGGAKVAEGGERGGPEGLGVPFEDINGAGHGGPVDVFSDDDGRSGRNVSPTAARVALILRCPEATSIFHIVWQVLGP